MEDGHAKLLEAIEKHMREDTSVSCAPQSITVNLNFFGPMDAGTLTAVKLLISALKAAQPKGLHSVPTKTV